MAEHSIPNQNYRKTALFLTLLGFLDTLGVATVIIQILPRISKLGASPVLGGFIASIYGAVQLVSSPIMGNVGDKINRKMLLVLCMLTSSASYYALGYPSLVVFSISRFISGIVKHTHLLMMATVADTVPPSEKGTYFGYFGASLGMGFIIGPVIGGHLAEMHNGFALNCTFAAVIFVINAALVYLGLPNYIKEKPAIDEEKKSKSQVGYLENLGIDQCWDVLLLQCFVEFGLMTQMTSFGLVIEDYGLQPKHVGYTIAVLSVIGTLTAMIAGKLEKLCGSKGLSYAIGYTFLCYVVLSIPISLQLYLTVLCFSSVGISLLRSWWPNLVTSRCAPDKAGAAVGATHSVLAIAGMLGPIVGGFSIEFFQSPHGPTYMATTILSCAVISCLWFPRPLSKLKVN